MIFAWLKKPAERRRLVGELLGKSNGTKVSVSVTQFCSCEMSSKMGLFQNGKGY
jgi:hypothetical protein